MHHTENQNQNASQNPPPAEGTRHKVHYTSLPNGVLDLQAKGKLSVYAVSVGLWLARYARQKNECFPSVDTLSRSLRVSRTSVYTGLKELEAAGLLKTRKRRGRGGNHNVYALYFWKHLNGTADTPDKISLLTKNRANVQNPDVHTPTTKTFQRLPRGREVYELEEKAMKNMEQVEPDANFENREIRGDSANASANAPHDCQSGWVYVTNKNGNQCVKRCPHCKAKWEQPTIPTGANASEVSAPDLIFGQNFPGTFFDRRPGQREAELPGFKEQPPALVREVNSTESVVRARGRARDVVTGQLFDLCWQAFEQCTKICRTSLDERTKKRMNGMLRNAAFRTGSLSAFQAALDQAIKRGGMDQPPLKLLGSVRFAAA